MRFRLQFTREAVANLQALEDDKGLSKRLRAVRKALGLLETNPRHPSLNTHKFSSLHGPGGEDVFEAYAESKTPAAYRIFWIYGPEQGGIIVISITSHP
jgi:hypothetical protein